jgi:hypothetical protein
LFYVGLGLGDLRRPGIVLCWVRVR